MSDTQQVGVVPAEETKHMTGIEILEAIIDGRLPQPPMTAVLPFQLVEAGIGYAVIAGEPTAALYNPAGTVHAGYAMAMLDSALGCAVQSELPAGRAATTLETKVNFLRPITSATGPVRAVGRALGVGRRAGVAEGKLIDADDKTLAYGSSTCMIFDL